MTEEEWDEAMALAMKMVEAVDPNKPDFVKLRALAFVVGSSCLGATGGDIKEARRTLKVLAQVAAKDMQDIVSDPYLHMDPGGVQ